MIGIRRADFDYGNTRLRARTGRLLRDADYERLLGEDIDGAARVRSRTRRTRREAEAAGRAGGLQRAAPGDPVPTGRSLEEMRSFYAGRARELVDVLLSRFDVQNVVSVLRARAHPADPVDDALAALVAGRAGSSNRSRSEMLRQRELAGVVDLLARRTPDREQAGALRAAFGEYERTE